MQCELCSACFRRRVFAHRLRRFYGTKKFVNARDAATRVKVLQRLDKLDKETNNHFGKDKLDIGSVEDHRRQGQSEKYAALMMKSPDSSSRKQVINSHNTFFPETINIVTFLSNLKILYDTKDYKTLVQVIQEKDLPEGTNKLTTLQCLDASLEVGNIEISLRFFKCIKDRTLQNITKRPTKKNVQRAMKNKKLTEEEKIGQELISRLLALLSETSDQIPIEDLQYVLERIENLALPTDTEDERHIFHALCWAKKPDKVEEQLQKMINSGEQFEEDVYVLLLQAGAMGHVHFKTCVAAFLSIYPKLDQNYHGQIICLLLECAYFNKNTKDAQDAIDIAMNSILGNESDLRYSLNSEHIDRLLKSIHKRKEHDVLLDVYRKFQTLPHYNPNQEMKSLIVESMMLENDPESDSLLQSVLMNALVVQEKQTNYVLKTLLDVYKQKENLQKCDEIYECSMNLPMGFPNDWTINYSPTITKEHQKEKTRDVHREIYWNYPQDSVEQNQKLASFAQECYRKKSLAFQDEVSQNINDFSDDILRLSLKQLLEIPSDQFPNVLTRYNALRSRRAEIFDPSQSGKAIHYNGLLSAAEMENEFDLFKDILQEMKKRDLKPEGNRLQQALRKAIWKKDISNARYILGILLDFGYELKDRDLFLLVQTLADQGDFSGAWEIVQDMQYRDRTLSVEYYDLLFSAALDADEHDTARVIFEAMNAAKSSWTPKSVARFLILEEYEILNSFENWELHHYQNVCHSLYELKAHLPVFEKLFERMNEVDDIIPDAFCFYQAFKSCRNYLDDNSAHKCMELKDLMEKWNVPLTTEILQCIYECQIKFDSDIRWMEQLKKLQNDRGFTFDKLDDSVVQRIMNRMDGSDVYKRLTSYGIHLDESSKRRLFNFYKSTLNSSGMERLFAELSNPTVEDYNDVIRVAVKSRDGQTIQRLTNKFTFDQSNPNVETFAQLFPLIDSKKLQNDSMFKIIQDLEEPTLEMYTGILRKLKVEGNLADSVVIVQQMQEANMDITSEHMGILLEAYLNTCGYHMLKNNLTDEDTVEGLLIHLESIDTAQTMDAMVQACLEKGETGLAIGLHDYSSTKYDVSQDTVCKWITHIGWENFSELKSQVDEHLTQRGQKILSYAINHPDSIRWVVNEMLSPEEIKGDVGAIVLSAMGSSMQLKDVLIFMKTTLPNANLQDYMYLIRSIHTKWELRLFFTELAERNFNPDTSFWRTFIDRVSIRDHMALEDILDFVADCTPWNVSAITADLLACLEDYKIGLNRVDISQRLLLWLKNHHIQASHIHLTKALRIAATSGDLEEVRTLETQISNHGGLNHEDWLSLLLVCGSTQDIDRCVGVFNEMSKDFQPSIQAWIYLALAFADNTYFKFQDLEKQIPRHILEHPSWESVKFVIKDEKDCKRILNFHSGETPAARVDLHVRMDEPDNWSFLNVSSWRNWTKKKNPIE